MVCEIPEEFDKKWFLSDVVILTKNAGGKKLYVSKAVLIASSPFFQALFFSSLNEGNGKVVKMSYIHKELKEIIWLVHHLGCEHIQEKFYDSKVLTKLYMLADMFLMPSVKQMIIMKMVIGPSDLLVSFAEHHGITDKIVQLEQEISPTAGKLSPNCWKALLSKKEAAGKMPCDIPKDLEHPWLVSDLILVSQDSQERKIYVSKAVVSSYSRVLRQFIKPFLKEEEMKSLTVPMDYSILQEIMRAIHHTGCDCLQQHVSVSLQKMYKTAEKLAMPYISNFCLLQLQETPSPESALFAYANRLYDLFLVILERMSFNDVQQTLLSITFDGPLFSKEDMAFVCRRSRPSESTLRAREMPIYFLPTPPRELQRFPVDLEIMTRNPYGRSLKGNRKLLSCLSAYFRNYLQPETRTVHVNIDHDTMDLILHMLRVYAGEEYESNRGFGPELLYDVYRSGDRLGIPVLKILCSGCLKQKKCWMSLELAEILGDRARNQLLMSMENDELWRWLCIEDHQLFISSDKKEVIRPVSRAEKILTVKQFQSVYSNLMSS